MTQRAALIDSTNTVVNIVIVDSLATYVPPPGLTALPGANAGIGYVWNGTTFVPPTPPPDTPADLKAYATVCRLTWEYAGVTVNGITDKSDLVSQQKVAALKTAFDNGTITGTVSFKADTGWFTADGPTVTKIYVAMIQRVQQAYATERSVWNQIDTGRITTKAQVAAAFGM